MALSLLELLLGLHAALLGLLQFLLLVGRTGTVVFSLSTQLFDPVDGGLRLLAVLCDLLLQLVFLLVELIQALLRLIELLLRLLLLSLGLKLVGFGNVLLLLLLSTFVVHLFGRLSGGLSGDIETGGHHVENLGRLLQSRGQGRSHVGNRGNGLCHTGHSLAHSPNDL